MPKNIPGVDRTHIAEWALAQMVRSMKLSEAAFDNYNYNKSLVVNSVPGDRSIPRAEDLAVIAADNQMHVRNAHMYAAIFTAMELADESPHRAKYVEAIKAAAASLTDKQIPRQR